MNAIGNLLRRIRHTKLGVLATSVVLSGVAEAAYIDPLPYLQMSDSPFLAPSGPFALSNLGAGFWVEDFEDGLLNTPGVSAAVNPTVNGIFGPRGPVSISDSVDADDGVLDGHGIAWSYHVDPAFGSQFVHFTFDASSIGALPTHAGVVWTDGGGRVRFEAFDETGASLGVQGSYQFMGSGQSFTDNDHFLGVINEGGISSIRVSNDTSGIEVDHLQYGALAVPGPSPIGIVGLPIIALLGRRALSRIVRRQQAALAAPKDRAMSALSRVPEAGEHRAASGDQQREGAHQSIGGRMP